MRKFALALAAVAALFVAPVAAQAQGFIAGLLFGGMLFGGNTQYGSSGGMIIYSADEDVLKQVSWMKVRFVSQGFCGDYNRNASMPNTSLEELFNKIKHHPDAVVLQILRVIDSDGTMCGSFWFAYVDRADMPPTTQQLLK